VFETSSPTHCDNDHEVLSREVPESALLLGTGVVGALGPNFSRVYSTQSCRLCRARHRRHTAATMLRAQGVGPRTIMETLGHSQISLTLDTCSHVMPTLQQGATTKMNDILTAKPA
jgi:hypothetical protein